METLSPGKQSLKNSFLRSPLLSAGTCHSPNRSWYPQRLHCHRNYFRNRYQYGGFSFGETLMLMGRIDSDNNESAGEEKICRVSKAGCYIKPLLVQCANAVVTSKSIRRFVPLSPSQKASRSQESNHCLSKNASDCIIPHAEERCENYNAELYRKSDQPPVDREIT